MKQQIETRIQALKKQIIGLEEWLPITTDDGRRLYNAIIRCHKGEVEFLEKLLLSLEAEKMAKKEPKS